MACILPTRRRRRGSAPPRASARGAGGAPSPAFRAGSRPAPRAGGVCSAPGPLRAPAAPATRARPPWQRAPRRPLGPARPASARSPRLPQCRPGGGRGTRGGRGGPGSREAAPSGAGALGGCVPRGLWSLSRGAPGRRPGRGWHRLGRGRSCGPCPERRRRLQPGLRPPGRTEGSGPRATPSVVDTPTAPVWRPSLPAPPRAGLP